MHPDSASMASGAARPTRARRRADDWQRDIRTRATAVGATPTTFYNVGGYINPSDQFSLLFSAGHSIAGQSHAIGYVGLYYTYPTPTKP